MPGCCSRCGRRVYAAEERLALDRSWHLECFTCGVCNRSLDSTNLTECKIRDEIYCNICYRQYFGLSGYGFGSLPALIVHKAISFPKLPNDCPKDQKIDYVPQDPRSIPPPPSRLGKTFDVRHRVPPHYEYHVSIRPGDPCIDPLERIANNGYRTEEIVSNFFTDPKHPNETDPGLQESDQNYVQSDSTSLELPDEECRPVSPQRQRNSQGPVFENPRKHSNRSNPGTSSDECSSYNYSEKGSPRRGYNDNIAPKPPNPTKIPAPRRTSMGQNSSPKKHSPFNNPICLKCEQPVFQAELHQGFRGTYHKSCFRCYECSKQLSPSTVNEDQGELFCKACHRRNFGTR